MISPPLMSVPQKALFETASAILQGILNRSFVDRDRLEGKSIRQQNIDTCYATGSGNAKVPDRLIPSGSIFESVVYQKPVYFILRHFYDK